MKRIAVLAATVIALSMAPRPAQAGTYVVHSCDAGFVAANSSPATLTVDARCPASPDQSLSGHFVSSTVNQESQTGATASWTLAAPAGLVMRRLDVQRSIGRRSELWDVSVRTAEGTQLESCPLVGQLSCVRGQAAADQGKLYDDLRTNSVSFRVRCDAGTYKCVARPSPMAWISVYDITATVEDSTAPAFEPLSGTALASGWRRGTAVIKVATSDASGVATLTLSAAGVPLGSKPQFCDYSRMRPCPASVREDFLVDLARLPDGTHEVQAMATDAAGQVAASTATLRVDQHAPGAPVGLKAERAADGTYSLTWSNPAQGTAAPVVKAHYRVCDALGVACTNGVANSLERVERLVVPSGGQVGVWLEDEAGNVDAGSAAVIELSAGAGSGPRVIGTNPPVLLPSGPADPPRLRVSGAWRSGSVLTLSGSVARGASSKLTAQLARTRTGKVLATAKATPRSGRWAIRVKLPSSLRKSSTLYLTLRFAGEPAFKKATLRRRLARKAASSGTSAVEFSLEVR